jgi:S1-C subfamily serine protease
VPTGGDVIVAIGGEPVDSHESLMRHLLLETSPGEEATVDLLRDGERLTERVTLAERLAPSSRRDRGRGRGRGGGHIPIH